MDEKLRPQGVTTAQLQVLKVVRDEPGVSGGEFGAVLLCHTTVSAVVAYGLEEDGWIVAAKIGE